MLLCNQQQQVWQHRCVAPFSSNNNTGHSFFLFDGSQNNSFSNLPNLQAVLK
jgi:hypothetical protein